MQPDLHLEFVPHALFSGQVWSDCHGAVGDARSAWAQSTQDTAESSKSRLCAASVKAPIMARYRGIERGRETACYEWSMMIGIDTVQRLTDNDLLASTRRLVERDHEVTANLLVHIGEIDARRLYLGRAFASMFAFCVGELGFSEDAAYNRITVARLGRRFPEVIETVRSGRVHISGLRLLAPHITEGNRVGVLAEAAGKSKRSIEEMVARHSPRPPVPATIRKVPESAHRTQEEGPYSILDGRQAGLLSGLPKEAHGPSHPREASEQALAKASATEPARMMEQPAPVTDRPSRASEHHSVVQPLAEEIFRVQFTASKRLRDKLREAQDLLRHQVRDGDLAVVLEKAVDLLIEDVKKKRFAVGRKARSNLTPVEGEKARTRHIPDAVKRAVYERDGGRCAFVDERGRRCEETGGLELDHVDGFARTHEHSVDRIRLVCRAHNQHAAEQMYGPGLMEAAKSAAQASRRTRSGDMAAARPGTTLGSSSATVSSIFRPIDCIEVEGQPLAHDHRI